MASAEYDIVVIGKIGMGKSTLGNKLVADGGKRFATDTDGSPYATTTTCELLSNDTMRVLDLPGFSDASNMTQSGRRVSAYEGNLEIIDLIVRQQAENNLQVRRVVYFLPVRGVLEKADGSLQEELQVMHHLFGPNIFNCMVVIATNPPRHQQSGYDEEDLERTKRVFHLALQMAINDSNIGCPPVVYIGKDDNKEEVLHKIRDAQVLQDEVLQKPEHTEPEPECTDYTEHINSNEPPHTDHVCSLCNITVQCDQTRNVLGVVDVDGTDDVNTVTAYEESKCHPCFKPYSMCHKIVGGFAHILTLGIFLFVGCCWGATVWPGFTNSEKVCPVCGRPPGTRGCTQVNENTDYGHVNHDYN